MKREGYFVFLFLACVALTITAVAEAGKKTMNNVERATARDDQNKCGENLTWSYDDSIHTLTIEGTGEMYNYPSISIPWSHLNFEIVIVKEGVTSIGQYAFEMKSPASAHRTIYLRNVTLPEGLVSIGQHAFSGCRILTSVTIPSTVSTIGRYAFEYCNSILSMDLQNTNITSIEEGTFRCCSNLTSLTLPSIATSIGQQAFYECSSLPSVELPPNITSIENRAFSSCKSLKTITIPSNVASIGESVFSGCCNLTSIDVDDDNPNYTSVDGVLFNKERTTLIQYPSAKSSFYAIPDSATTISQGAFNVCPNSTSIIIPSSVEIIETTFNDDCNEYSRTYLGTSEPQCVWSGSCSPVRLTTILPIDYSSSSFCEKPVTIEQASVNELKSQENHCYGAYVYGNEIINNTGVFKRPNATTWEQKTNGCVHYECDNETGGIIWSLCNSSDDNIQICRNNQCEEGINGYAVMMKLKGDMKASDYDEDEMKKSLEDISGVNKDEIDLGMELTKDGTISSVIVYVNDEKDSYKIELSVNECISQQSRKTTAVH